MRIEARIAALGAALVIALVAIDTGLHFRDAARRREARAARMAQGDPRAAPAAIAKYGCGGCHTIPGVPGARALVGPPLDHFAGRTFVAGELRNTPDNLVRWIMHPHDVEPKTAMPEMGVSERDARAIAAYLYTLE